MEGIRPRKNKINRNSLSYSRIVDSNAHLSGYRRKIKRWVADESVTICYECKNKFSTFLRKHHCRVCGKIYCYSCSDNKIMVPKEMLGDIPENPYSKTDASEHKVRACKKCVDSIINFKKFYQLIEDRKINFDIFKLKQSCPDSLAMITEENDIINDLISSTDISGSGSGFESNSDESSDDVEVEVEIASDHNSDRDSDSENDEEIQRAYKKYASNHNIQKQAAQYCISKLRSIQYKLPTEELTKLEKDLLWANRKNFSGHSKWLIQLLKIIDFRDTEQVGQVEAILGKVRKNNCLDMMCSRSCYEGIQLIDLIDILHIGLQHPIINKVIEKCVKNCDRDEAFLFMPLICYHVHNNRKLQDVILTTFEDDEAFMIEYYNCVRMYSPDREFIDDIEIYFQDTKYQEKITNMRQLQTFSRKRDYRDLYTPIDPSTQYRKIDRKNIKTLDGVSKPVLIPFVKENGTVKRIILKGDDVRKDHIVSNLIALAHSKLKKAGIINIDIIRYRISPLTHRSGLIEFVENSNTIYHITENLEFTVQNYINEYNPHKTSGEIIDRFMQSAALYCMLTYLLGIGDRHLDNIMISQSGLLFHIDFGYILGKDPKYSSNHIKIAPEIINVIGGKKSENWKKFKEYCSKIYAHLRIHINAFMNMLLVVSHIDKKITHDQVKEILLSRFEVGENSVDAAIHMGTKINRGGYTYMDKAVDIMYKSKQSTVTRGWRYLSDLRKNIKAIL